MDSRFSLWLEFEHCESHEPWDDFCNAQITIDGSTYAVNIWTFAYVDRARHTDVVGLPVDPPNIYLLPPDLLVERLDRATISQSISDLLARGSLPEAWRVHVVS
nr:putative integron gene cassette protein [uncultured bacterium]